MNDLNRMLWKIVYKIGNYHIGQLQIGNAAFFGVTAGVYSQLHKPLDKRAARVGVFGNAFDNYVPRDVGLDIDKVYCKAQIIGESIANEGLIFVNGACPGIPNIAAQGSRAKNGIVTGFSPLENEAAHLDGYNLSKDEIPHTLITYLGKTKSGKQIPVDIDRLFITRDVVSIFSSDAIVVIGGSYGTNHEVAVAAELGLLIMLLKGTGGVAHHAKEYYESIRKPNNSSHFIEEENPKVLVERMLGELNSRDALTRQFNPGKDPLDAVIQRIEAQQHN